MVAGCLVTFFFIALGGCGGLSEKEVPRDAERVGDRVVTFSGVWRYRG